jgi:hypothetical protein
VAPSAPGESQAFCESLMNSPTSSTLPRNELGSDQWNELLDSLKTLEYPTSVEGLPGASKAYLLAQAWKRSKRPQLVITSDQVRGETWLSNLRYFLHHEKVRVSHVGPSSLTWRR